MWTIARNIVNGPEGGCDPELTAWNPTTKGHPGLLDVIGVPLQRYLWQYLHQLGASTTKVPPSSAQMLLESTQAVFTCALREIICSKGVSYEEVYSVVQCMIIGGRHLG